MIVHLFSSYNHSGRCISYNIPKYFLSLFPWFFPFTILIQKIGCSCLLG